MRCRRQRVLLAVGLCLCLNGVLLPFFFLTRGLRQMRRNSKENNFKAILETIRDVMNVAAIGNAVPEWLHDVFLGYGDAAAAHYKNLPTQIPTLDMVDTFLNGAHAASCFPGQQVVFQTEDGKAIADDVIPTLQPPFRATFSPVAGRHRRFLPVCEKRMNLRAAMVVCNPVYRMLSGAQRMTVTLPSCYQARRPRNAWSLRRSSRCAWVRTQRTCPGATPCRSRPCSWRPFGRAATLA